MGPSIEWSEIVPHLTGIAHLATVSELGEPHVAVVAPAVEGAVVWIGAERAAALTRNLAANPRGALVWRPGAEAYVWGDATASDDVADKRRLWDGAWSYDPEAFFGSPESPDYVLLRFVPVRATVMLADASGPKRKRWHA